MSDFGELCPLFATGVFKEVTFPYIRMTDQTASGNALIGTLLSISHIGAFSFGRTVVVTGAFLRQRDVCKGLQVLLLNHHTTQRAAGTEFGSVEFSITVALYEPATYKAMNVTAKTFASSDILGFSQATGTAASGGVYDLIVRYKEK